MPLDSINAEFPDKLQCLFQPKRIKVLWGGRGAGRSWGVARAALLIGASREPVLHPLLYAPLRVLCVREYQNSIAESVHKVLSDQIEKKPPEGLALSHIYEIQRDKIIGHGPAEGTTFSFEGIKNNANRIKSYEGIDLCWAEEAVKISRNSWGILLPTIRKPNSEIWMTFNPELESDYTFRRFVLDANSEESVVVKMTWRDNPWFGETALPKMMELDRLRDPDYFLNVWEGNCRQILEGAVYAKELRRMQEDGRITQVGWDPEWPVDTAWDLGRADATAIWFFQRIAMQHRVIDYFESIGDYVGDTLKELQSKRYLYGTHFLPHDARAKVYGTKLSIEETVRQHYPQLVFIVPRLSPVDGINAARMLMARCWMDQEKCSDGLTALRHYRYDAQEEADDSPSGQRVVLSDKPRHDWASHAADAFRYMAVGASRRKGNEVTPSETSLGRFDQAEKMLASMRRRASDAFGWMS